ncbi:uncharacterized protein V6R79_005200 [Siganus canaliculatus]
MGMFGAVSLAFGSLVLQMAGGALDNHRQGLTLEGDYTITALFTLHYTSDASVTSAPLPALSSCNKATPIQHGFHRLQALRFAVEEINNGTGPDLLPGVRLGYQVFDSCSDVATLLTTLEVLKQQQSSSSGTEANTNSQVSVAVIGPNSSDKCFTSAALLGAYLIPQISYGASNEMLSNKNLYPSFFRTIPSDKNQVTAMIQLLLHFNWTWISLLGSDDAYGLQGMRSLSEQAPHVGICIAYQGTIPSFRPDRVQEMKHIVQSILKTNVNTIVVFASKTFLLNIFPFFIEQNVTDKVWIGTEDWSSSSIVSGIPGVHTIGTVIGISIKYAAISGFEEFERKVFEAAMQENDLEKEVSASESTGNDSCVQDTDLYTMARRDYPLDEYDITSSFNVYKAVYAVAHALHRALGCDSGECQKRRVEPWELLLWLKQAHFSLDNNSVYFDSNGDPPTGYDIISWVWKEMEWSVRTVGSFSPDPISLTVDADLIEWHNAEDSPQVPLSICSPPCPKGHMKELTGQHTCCFNCLPCPAGTFLNHSDPTTCQKCFPEQWSPEKSEQCLNRSVLLLAWDSPLSIALLFFLAGCLFLTSSSAIILLLNLNTPVAKSAGGRTCLLMLAALTAAAMSSLCHFGHPSPLACILKQPLFILSFTVFLACITVRSVQVVCIFKFASKLPPAYDKWAKKHGPEYTILLLSVTVLFLSVIRVALDPPKPSQDLTFYTDSIVLECSNILAPGSLLELSYMGLLSIICFSFSYMGKDLPANYNEAKSVSFSLMVYMISWTSFFTIHFISRDSFTMAAYVFAILLSVLVFVGGYFLPKIYIIVLKPQLNTAAHFQNCIQMYTMSK